MRRLILWSLAGAALIGGSVILTTFSINHAVTNQRQINQQICLSFKQFAAIMRPSLERSQKNLPNLTYMQSHPVELARQEAQVARQLRQLNRHRC